MANTLGTLVVKLGLDAAQFTSGLTKAEFEAQQFAAKFAKGIDKAISATVTSLAAIGTAAAAAAVAIDQLAKQTAKFKDLEEITGASAESLASFAVSAKVAGTDMSTVAAASVKLTKGLTGVDDESKAAGAALSALGINIKDFKQLDPATQIDEIAKALDGFKDGAGKTAVALALFGKAGADLLPFLKELGSGIGRQTILTQAQIEAADKYADTQARATAELNLYLQVLASQALGPMTAFTNALKEFAKDLLQVDDVSTELGSNTAVETFAINTAKALAFAIDAADGVIRVFRIVNEVLSVGVQKAGPAIRAILDQEQFSAKLERQLRDLEANRRLPGESGGRRREAKTLVFDGADKNAKALKEQTSEADRYLESLKKQLEKTEELTVVQQIQRDIDQGRIKGLTASSAAQALAIGAQIDAAHELAAAIKEINKAQEEANRVAQAEVKRIADATKAANDNAGAVIAANIALKEEIEIIKGGDAARVQIEQRHIDSAIARNEEALAMHEQIKGHQGIAAALRIEIEALKARKGFVGERELAKQLAIDARNLQDFKNIFADSAANAFTDFITGARSAKDAFRDFVSSVNRQISQIASQNIANAIFGGDTGKGFDLSRIVNQLTGGLVGTPAPTTASAAGAVAGAAGETATAAAATALTGSAGTLAASGAVLDASGLALSASSLTMDASALALTGAATALVGAAGALAAAAAAEGASEIAGLLGKGIGLAAGGGLAGGTDFARGGLTLVGERGPELINLPRGSRVTPNDQLSKLGRPNLSIVVNVPQGTSGPSADQIGIRVGAHVQRALNRNG